MKVEASGAGVCLAGDDVDVDRGADLGVEPDADLVRADGLDRVADLDPPPVEFGTARLADRLGDVGGPDRAEQPAGSAPARRRIRTCSPSSCVAITLASSRPRISRADLARLISPICFSAPRVHGIAKPRGIR